MRRYNADAAACCCCCCKGVIRTRHCAPIVLQDREREKNERILGERERRRVYMTTRYSWVLGRWLSTVIGHRQSHRGAYEVATLISKHLVHDKSLTALDSVCDLFPSFVYNVDSTTIDPFRPFQRSRSSRRSSPWRHVQQWCWCWWRHWRRHWLRANHTSRRCVGDFCRTVSLSRR